MSRPRTTRCKFPSARKYSSPSRHLRIVTDIVSKSGDVVEQIMKPQWWVSCKPMAEEALKVCLAFKIASMNGKVAILDRWLTSSAHKLAN